MSSILRIVVLLAGAFAAWGLWLAEVYQIKGWAGLAWLAGFNWSALPICALTMIVTSYFVAGKVSWTRRALFSGVAWVIAIIAFTIARWAAIEMFSSRAPSAGMGAGVLLVVAALIASLGLVLAANRWLTPTHYWAGILVAIALALAVLLSFATIKVFPAANGSTDQIHSIKMGYPVFWTALLLPLAVRLGRKKASGHTS